jgi:hypothetical protein
VFLFALMVDVGQQEISRVQAQSGVATTSLTVINTPPEFVSGPFEIGESSIANPTNSGASVVWGTTAVDANGADYYFLVCSTNASPTPSTTGEPSCGAGAIQWAVSGATPSGDPVTIATTTVEAADDPTTDFNESNDWFAWVCDADSTQPACSVIPQQGTNATNSSPFIMNQRPQLTSATNNGPVDPASSLTFSSVSTDIDTLGGSDTLELIVCSTNTNYSTTTNSCSDYLASSSVATAETNASAATTTPSIIRDQVYSAFVYLIDNHGHEASAPIQANFEIANVAPTLLSGGITLNGGTDISLANPGGETTGFTLDFTVRDANSCINSTGATSSEMIGFDVAVFRTGAYSTSTNCNPAASDYNPNGCYTSGVASTTWNLSCTAATSSCTGITDDTQDFNCTFPLWFLADPTDVGSPFDATDWTAAVAGGDDDFATSSLVGMTPGFNVELLQAPALALRSGSIPYGDLAPGDATPTLSATTTVANFGNTGIDQQVDGSAMCPEYTSSSSDCSLQATSTIFADNQRFNTSNVTFSSGIQLATTTPGGASAVELELDVPKTTQVASTSWEVGDTYWGISVPNAITVAGAYTGQNTFYVQTAEAIDW